MYRRGIINRNTLSVRCLPDLHCIVVTGRSNKRTVRRPGNGPHKSGMPAINDLGELLRRHRLENRHRRPEARTGTLQEPEETLCTGHQSRARYKATEEDLAPGGTCPRGMNL